MIYRLTHRYAINKDTYDVYFNSKFNVSEVNRYIAYIQFLTDEIAPASELRAKDIIQLLRKYYDKTVETLARQAVDYKIDEYEVWDYYSSNSDEILSSPFYKREGIEDDIKLILKSYEVE